MYVATDKHDMLYNLVLLHIPDDSAMQPIQPQSVLWPVIFLVFLLKPALDRLDPSPDTIIHG